MLIAPDGADITLPSTSVEGNDNMRAVAYYRVSTDKQGRSGLGLDAQREAVRRYMGSDYPPIAEFTEIESGKRSDRPQLKAALHYAKVHRAALIVAKVDRLSRNAHFLGTVLAGGVEVVFCDIPQVSGAIGQFIIQQMAAVAQLEAGLISERTKAALQAAKQRGKVLGGFRGHKLGPELGVEAKRRRAAERAADLAPIVAEIQAAGHTSLNAIAAELTRREIPTARGFKAWSPIQASRLLAVLTR